MLKDKFNTFQTPSVAHQTGATQEYWGQYLPSAKDYMANKMKVDELYKAISTKPPLRMTHGSEVWPTP